MNSVFSSCRGGFTATGPPDCLSCSRKISLTLFVNVLQLPLISSCRTQRYYLLLFITLLLNLFVLITFAVPKTLRVNTNNDIVKSVWPCYIMPITHVQPSLSLRVLPVPRGLNQVEPSSQMYRATSVTTCCMCWEDSISFSLCGCLWSTLW